jgi:hypothetical protein
MRAQDLQQATVFARIANDWVGHIVSGNATLHMPEIDIDVPLTELYEGVVEAPNG